MRNPCILVIGGYGTTGKLIVSFLLQETDVGLIVAGRSLDRAREFADELNSRFAGERVVAREVDASKGDQLSKAFRDAGMVLMASGTSAHTDMIARAAIDSRIDYFDIQYSASKISRLKSIRAEIEKRGLCFITDGGFHPGLPGVLARWGASRFDTIQKAVVTSLIRLDWKRYEVGLGTAKEFISLLGDYDSSAFVDGKWKKASLFSSVGYVREDFGKPFHKQYCAPMFLEEMRYVAEQYPSMTDTGFYVGGFNWFVDYIVFPPAFIAMRLKPDLGAGLFARLMLFGVKKFSGPPYMTVLKLKAAGVKGGVKRELNASLSHEDGYVLTALPVTAALRQYLDGTARKPGLFTQAEIVDPASMFDDLVRMGVKWSMERKA